MNFRVSILSDAETDIDDAYVWYEMQLIGLGEKFFETIHQSVKFISKNPYSSEEIYKELRRFVIHKFPYGIYYRINSEKHEIQIIGVMHFKRNRRILKGRIPSK